MNCKRKLQTLLLPLLMLCSVVLYAQQRTVSGRVTDATGNGLAGVTVNVKNSSIATTTNETGTYSINVPADAATLVFSSVGYGSLEYAITADNTVNVRLQQNATNLNEVVVIGYGTARRRDLTGAVATVTSKDFVRGPITSPEQLIAGKVAGVQISSAGGAPGAGSRILIRGGASLNAGLDPLIVIDGVPVEPSVSGTPTEVRGSANPLNLINPNDIESFTVLKDPSAAAIYGSRASNGVILITTKKGRPGKLRIGLVSNSFIQTPARLVDVLSADELRQVVTTQGTAAEAARLGKENTDWQDQIFDNAFGQDFNLSVSGATLNNKLPFRVSGNLLDQKGILRTGKFARQSLSLNLSPRLFNNSLTIDANAKLVRTANRFADEGAIGAAAAFDPTQPVRTGSNRFGGFFEYLEPNNDLGPLPRDQSPRNPVALLELRDNRSAVTRFLGNIQLGYQIPFIKGLRANVNLGLDKQRGEGVDAASDSAGFAYRDFVRGRNRANTRDSVLQYGGFRRPYKSQSYNTLLDAYLSYNRDIRSLNSNVELLTGYGYQNFDFTTYNIQGQFFNGNLNPVGFNTNIPPSSLDGYTLISYYGRFVYTLANKYILKLDARTDGNSKFVPASRWGFFPAASFAWRIKEESFLKNSSAVNDLKLRIGYGETGQQTGVGFYEYIARYQLSTPTALYQLGNEFITLSRPAGYDPNLRWERTQNINIGLDYALFNNRLSGAIDVFQRKSKDLLNEIPVLSGTNFTNLLRQNVGDLQSRGAEFTVNAIPVQNRNVTWDLGFNITYAKPEITNLIGRDDPRFIGNRVEGIDGGTGTTIQINAVGGRPRAFYVYKQVYDRNNQPIEGLYEDLNRDGVINEGDLYPYMSPDPNVFAGLTSNLTVGKWSGGFVARAFFDNYVYDNIGSNLGVRRNIFNPLGFINNAPASYLNTNFANNQFFSDYYVQNASFVRMDNINIGYNAGAISRGVNMRVGLNLQNAFVITKYKGIDPEINGGIDRRFYPRPRTYTLSVNLDF